MDGRCSMCGLQKERVNGRLCGRCQDLEQLMGECLGDANGSSDSSAFSAYVESFGGRLKVFNLDFSWMSNFPIKVYKINTESAAFQVINHILYPSDSFSYSQPGTSVHITPHEFSFFISNDLNNEIIAEDMGKILNNIIKLIIMDALGRRYYLLRIVTYDGASTNAGGRTTINSKMLGALFYLDLDSPLQGLSSGKRILLVERVPWGCIAVPSYNKVSYYSRYGVGVLNI